MFLYTKPLEVHIFICMQKVPTTLLKSDNLKKNKKHTLVVPRLNVTKLHIRLEFRENQEKLQMTDIIYLRKYKSLTRCIHFETVFECKFH